MFRVIMIEVLKGDLMARVVVQVYSCGADIARCTRYEKLAVVVFS